LGKNVNIKSFSKSTAYYVLYLETPFVFDLSAKVQIYLSDQQTILDSG